MSLHFAYKLFATPKPVVTLGGRWVRPRPMCHISVMGPAGSFIYLGHLDSGADDTVFPDAAAAGLGIDLSSAPTGEAAGVTSAPLPLRYAQVTLRLTDGVEYREWPAWVGFTPVRLARPLLGFAGFQQFFTSTFHGDREEVELSVNALYPGI